MASRTTHTYALLEISASAHAEIAAALKAAGYVDAFHEDGIVDMHGIAVKAKPHDANAPRCTGHLVHDEYTRCPVHD